MAVKGEVIQTGAVATQAVAKRLEQGTVPQLLVLRDRRPPVPSGLLLIGRPRLAPLLKDTDEALEGEIPVSDATAVRPASRNAETRPALRVTATVVRQPLPVQTGQRVSQKLTRRPPAQEVAELIAAVGSGVLPQEAD